MKLQPTHMLAAANGKSGLVEHRCAPSASIRRDKRRAICRPLSKKIDSVSAPSQHKRSSARLTTGFKHGNIGSSANDTAADKLPNLRRRRQFSGEDAECLRFKPNNQAFRAIRFLRAKEWQLYKSRLRAVEIDFTNSAYKSPPSLTRLLGFLSAAGERHRLTILRGRVKLENASVRQIIRRLTLHNHACRYVKPLHFPSAGNPPFSHLHRIADNVRQLQNKIPFYPRIPAFGRRKP